MHLPIIRAAGNAATLLVLVLLGLTLPATAGEIEPRAYVNTPVDVNFVVSGYVYSDGGLDTVASSPLKDAQLTMNSALLAYARSFEFLGSSAKFDGILAFSDLSGSAQVNGQPRDRHVYGLNDPRFRLSWNFYGAPALTVQEFPDYQQDLILGASIQFSPPLGQYDRDKLVNLGNNRWFFKPDIGISKAWGDLVMELSGGAFIFTTNHDYYGGKKLEQDPLYTTQLHATYNFGKGVWGAVSLNYDYGGRTTVSNRENDDVQKNSRLGFTLALPVNRNNSVKLYGSTSLHTSVGSDIDTVSILWQVRWGGGL